MVSKNTKDIERLRERIKYLEDVLEDIVVTFEHDNWGWYGDCLEMANTAAYAIGRQKVRFDSGGYFIPAKYGRDIQTFNSQGVRQDV